MSSPTPAPSANPAAAPIGGAAGQALTSQGINLGGITLPGNSALGLNTVYMGKRTSVSRPTVSAEGGKLEPGKKTEEDNLMSLADARNLPMSWSEEEKDKFVRNGVLRKVPGFKEDMGIDEIMNAWDNFVSMSAKASQSGYKIAPQDLIDSYKSRAGTTYKKGNWEYDAVTDQPVKYVGPLTKTDTNTRIDLSTREDALALAKTSMAQALGRAPTAAELGNYLGLLNGYEQAHPATSTSVSNISPETGEVTSTNTTSTGGVTQAGRQALLEEQMQKNPEYGAYQAATTYYNAMMQEIMRGY